MHGPPDFLCLDVNGVGHLHDLIRSGQVLTVEPGIYIRIENDIVEDLAEPIEPEDGQGLIRITYPDARAAAEAVVSQNPLINSYGIHHLRIRLRK